jgi:hypothetical protein
LRRRPKGRCSGARTKRARHDGFALPFAGGLGVIAFLARRRIRSMKTKRRLAAAFRIWR